MNIFSEQARSASALKILQITDMHLFEDPNSTLLGVNTEQSFLATLEKAKSESWPPDLIFFTGDISQDSTEAAYTRLIEHISPLNIPCYTLPGNHDIPQILSATLNKPPLFSQAFLHTENWLFAFLDSATPNEEGGTLKDHEVVALEKEIQQHPDKNVLICLHHQVIEVGSEWLDTMLTVNTSSLFDLMKNTPAIKGIIHGHAHQEFESIIGSIPIWGCPSTCFQFAPHSKEFALGNEAPGYRWLKLTDNGKIETAVVRLDEALTSLEKTATGY